MKLIRIVWMLSWKISSNAFGAGILFDILFLIYRNVGMPGFQ